MESDLLRRGAHALGIGLGVSQLDQFAVYASELAAWNRRVNLTRIDEPDQVQVRHFLDSLTCAVPIRSELARGAAWRCVDVGSGAGFPGLPLRLVFPNLAMVLIEATAKKTAFLQHVVARLELSNVAVVTARAEELARHPDHRDGYDLAVARALAPLSVALEWCLPFIRPGGRLILPRGSDHESQHEAGRVAARELGAELRPPLAVTAPDLPSNRSLAIADKLVATPERYPRRVGIAAKRPLGRPSAE